MPVKKHGTIIVLDVEGQPKVYPKGMPIFALLGQDEFAPAAIHAYADALEKAAAEAEASSENHLAARLRKQAEEVRTFATNTRAWQLENPAVVKRPD